MNSESNGQADFKVVPVGTVKADLRRFHKQMMEQGEGTAFLDVLKQIAARLQKDPHGFGETLYRLPAVKLMIHQGVLIPLAVTYGIHDDLPLVLIRVVKLLSKPEA